MGNTVLLPVLISQVMHFLQYCLIAVADVSYMFTYVDEGDYGRQCDSAVFNNSTFGKALKNYW